MTELLSNCLKHAFPPGHGGQVAITLRAVGEKILVLTVKDNGVGIPGHIDPEDCPSLGLDLVAGFVEQLDGTLEICRDGGTEIKITFEEPHIAKDG